MALLIILLSISKIYGQYYSANDYFSVSRYVEIKDVNNYSASTIFDFSNSVPKVFNVHFYGLETSINVSNYPQGIYGVALVCDGIIVDAENLIIE